MRKTPCYFAAILFLCLGCIKPSTISAQENEIANANETKGVCLVNRITNNCGMFAVFASVLGSLHLYETGHYAGLKIYFDNGVYLDPKRGPNWWEYYFEPINLGDTTAMPYAFSWQEVVTLTGAGFKLPRRSASLLIQKYIHVKPHIQREVNTFVNKYFKNHFVIGVHHRGTDKAVEAPLVSYEKTCKALKRIIAGLTPVQANALKIYVATDDHHFLAYLLTLYPNNVIYNNFARSIDGTPLHYGDFYANNYQRGKEALIDCLLLSRCQTLLRPYSSSLSMMSANFNPIMPVVALAGDEL